MQAHPFPDSRKRGFFLLRSFFMTKNIYLLIWTISAYAGLGMRVAEAQRPPSYLVCLKFARPTGEAKAVRLNQQPALRVMADTCVRLAYPGPGIATLVVEAEGCFAQSLHFRPDTLRGPVRVMLLPREVELKEVVVQAASAARYRGDTLVLRVDSVRTQPHASATDLLNNMAGASVGADGQVRVLGKNVGRVTVEGKPLYGGNPKAALEALNADMIKNLELSEVPGASGEGSANLNIRLKDDHKAGSYGRVEGLAGTSGTYAASARVSQLKEGNLLSAFATANNIYQQALTTDDQNTLVRNTILKDVQGAYSVTETALPRPSSVQADRTVQNIVEVPLSAGRMNTLNGGLNYNRTTPRAELFGYVLAEHATQRLDRLFSTTRYLDPYRQQEDGASTDRYTRTKATAYLTGKWPLTPQQTLSTASLLGARRLGTDMAGGLATLLLRDGQPLAQGGLLRQLASQEQFGFASQQLAWVKRYARPAEVTSFYAKYGFSSHQTDQTYANYVRQGGQEHLFSNRIERAEQAHSWEAQALHALPLSRKLLLEGKLTWSREVAPISQRGYNRAGGSPAESFAPGLSLEQFRIIDQQQTARLTLYYKAPRFSALLSPTLWHWASQRQLNETTLVRQQRTAFVPGFFVEYRPDAVTRLSLRYGQSQVLPSPERLFPVPDSSNIQFVKVGNSALVQLRRQALEATATSAWGANHFTLTARYGAENPPILFDTRPNSLGFLTQTYRQPDLLVPSLSASLLWFQLNQLRNYSFQAFTTGQWLRNYLLTQNEPTALRMFVGVAVAGMKWKGPGEMAVKLDWRTILTQQHALAGGGAPARNFRHEPVLALEKKWGPKLYAELTATAFVNTYAQGPTTTNMFLDATLSRFIGPNERFRLLISGRNLLNNKVYRTNAFAANVQRQEAVGRLPGLVLVGISVYPEKWK